MIKPTTGRRILYWPSLFDTTGHRDPIGIVDVSQPCDAGIAFVHNDRLVNLTVADHAGGMHARTEVQLLQDDDAAPGATPGEVAYATWMDYQIQQQAIADGQIAPTIEPPAPPPAKNEFVAPSAEPFSPPTPAAAEPATTEATAS